MLKEIVVRICEDGNTIFHESIIKDLRNTKSQIVQFYRDGKYFDLEINLIHSKKNYKNKI